MIRPFPWPACSFALPSLLALAACRPSPPPLPAGAGHAGTLAPGQTEELRLDLEAGESLRLSALQQGADVVLEVLGPDGERLLAVDGPLGGHGVEPVCLVAAAAGEHRLRVRPAGEGGGAYTLHREARRPATAADRACSEAARSLSELRRRLWEEGEASEALLALGEEALSRWPPEESFQRALTLDELAEVASRLGAVAAQADYLEQAGAALGEEPAGEGRRRLRAQVLNALGLVLRSLGRIEESRRAWSQARVLFSALGDTESEAAVRNNLALILRDRGETHRALREYRAILETLEAAGLVEAQAPPRLNLGESYAEVGQIPEAMAELGEARRLAEAAGDTGLRVRVRIALGWAHRLAGEPAAAAEPLEQAVELAVAGELEALEAAARDRLGTVFRLLGRFPEALDSYQRSLAISRRQGRGLNLANTTANLGWLYLDWGRPGEALPVLAEARRRLEEVGDPDALWYVLLALGEAERALGRPEAALEHLEAAAPLVEELRTMARRLGERMPRVPLLPDLDERRVDLLVELAGLRPGRGYGARAFEVADRARAGTLVEMLTESRLGVRDGAGPELLERERVLQRRVNAVGAERRALAEAVVPEVARAENQKRRAELERDLGRLLVELEETRAAMREQSPRWAELFEPRPVGLGQVQALLGPGTTLLSYALGEERSFLFAVTAGDLEIHELPGRSELRSLARAVHTGFQSQVPRTQSRVSARRLAEALLGPVAARLAGERLLVAPAGALHYVPFGALPDPAAGDGAVVLDRFEVVHLPSAAVLAELRRRGGGPWEPPPGAAVLADPVFSAADPRVEGPAASPAAGDLPRLPFSRREGETVVALAGPERSLLALGFEARRELVTGGGLAGYPLVHLATHAEVDDERPELSGLALTQVDRRGGPVEGWLRLHEIYGLELDARLVVLSGCRTALGEEVRGEGILGLTRGFLFAGAPRVVVSLWDADDEAAAELMTLFYRGLYEGGLAPPAALRQAQRELRRREAWSAPYFWAGFVLQGEWR